MTRSCLLVLFSFFAALSVSAETTPEWRNPSVNQQNREARRANFFAYESESLAMKGDKSSSSRYLSMEGMWRFHFVKNHQDAPAAFFRPDFDDSKWEDFPVPGLFELNGHGDPIYKNIGYAWCTTFDSNPPFIGETENYTGSYRREFTLPDDWKGQQVLFHVGSATSNLKVWVNGRYVGYSEDSKIAAEFDITKYLQKGNNLIAMQVMRWCDGSYLEDQDFWRFTGIAREVYLYARPKVHVEDLTITQDFIDGKGVLNFHLKSKGNPGICAELYDAEGNRIGEGCMIMDVSYDDLNVKPWSAETPNLYTLYITIIKEDELSKLVGLHIKVSTHGGVRNLYLSEVILALHDELIHIVHVVSKTNYSVGCSLAIGGNVDLSSNSILSSKDLFCIIKEHYAYP